MNNTIIANIPKTTNTERGMFVYGSNTIYYNVIRKPSNNKFIKRKIAIKVYPNCSVEVTVPKDAALDYIQQVMLNKARWIWQNIQQFTEQREYVTTKQYISGDVKFYLGKFYQLKIGENNVASSNVKLKYGMFYVLLDPTLKNKLIDDKKQLIKQMVDNWYKKQANKIFTQRLNLLLPKTSWVKNIPLFKIRKMQKQWGSCSAKGNLIFNPHLVKAPLECIDYIILHELCHILEHNHSTKFWSLLMQVMPHYNQVKIKLDDMAEFYLNV